MGASLPVRWSDRGIEESDYVGTLVVRQIKHVDENSREVYFTAGGREKAEIHITATPYRIKFDGTDLQLRLPKMPSTKSRSVLAVDTS